MRFAAILLLPPLFAGCAGVPGGAPIGAFASLNMAAVPVIHRDVLDAVWSTITGQDCSVVRLDQNQGYCKPIEPPPDPPPYCTRSLGTVDCWKDPSALPAPIPAEVADGPRTLTPAQEQNRTQGWPPL